MSQLLFFSRFVANMLFAGIGFLAGAILKEIHSGSPFTAVFLAVFLFYILTLFQVRTKFFDRVTQKIDVFIRSSIVPIFNFWKKR